MTPRGLGAAAVATLLACTAAGCSSSPSAPAKTAGHPVPKHSGTAHVPSAAAPVRLRVAVAGELPHGLSRTVAVADNGQILLLGGLVPGDTTTSVVLRFDPVSGTTATAGRLALAVHDASGAVLGGRALVFGGGAATSVADVQAFTGGTGAVVGRLDRGRSDSAAAVLGSTAYVAGGFDGSAMVRTIDATSDGAHVRQAGSLVLGVRYPAVAAAGGWVWIVGGQLATTESTRSGGQTDDIQRFDPATGRTTIAGHLPEPLGHATAFALGGAVYVAGGRSGSQAVRTVWRIDPATGRATAVATLPRAASDMAAVVIGDKAWLIGGETTGPEAPLRTVLTVSIAQ